METIQEKQGSQEAPPLKLYHLSSLEPSGSLRPWNGNKLIHQPKPNNVALNSKMGIPFIIEVSLDIRPLTTLTCSLPESLDLKRRGGEEGRRGKINERRKNRRGWSVEEEERKRGGENRAGEGSKEEGRRQGVEERRISSHEPIRLQKAVR